MFDLILVFILFSRYLNLSGFHAGLQTHQELPASCLLHMLHPLPGMLFPQVFTRFTFLLWILLLKVSLIMRSFLTTYQTLPCLLFLLIASACHCLFFSITSENLPKWLNYPLLQCIEGSSRVVVVVKTLPANAGDVKDSSSYPRSGRSPGEGRGKSL